MLKMKNLFLVLSLATLTPVFGDEVATTEPQREPSSLHEEVYEPLPELSQAAIARFHRTVDAIRVSYGDENN